METPHNEVFPFYYFKNAINYELYGTTVISKDLKIITTFFLFKCSRYCMCIPIINIHWRYQNVKNSNKYNVKCLEYIDALTVFNYDTLKIYLIILVRSI